MTTDHHEPLPLKDAFATLVETTLAPGRRGTAAATAAPPRQEEFPDEAWARLTPPTPASPRTVTITTAASSAAPLVAKAVARPVDWNLVKAFRVEASNLLSKQLQDSPDLTPEQQQERGRAIIAEMLDQSAQKALADGTPAWTLPEQQRMARAIFDALFRLGRLQPLVDDADIENIEINGYDNVLLQYADGRMVRGEPIAESDDDLVDFLAFVASRSRTNPRSFSVSNPRLHMRLDDGQRLAATAWVTPRPVAVIRRHRLVDVTLHDLVGRQMLTWSAAEFLAAAVKDRRSIVVAGPPGAGKTTLVRALANEIHPGEKVGTFETEFELHLDQSSRWERGVWAFEARPGSGEIGPTGRPAGEVTLDELIFDSFRFNLDRQIVGEVRGKEITAMIKVMQSGAGSLSTTHSRTAREAVGKLITCAMETGPHVTEDYARRAIAESVDLVVQIELARVSATGDPIRDRYVSEIVALDSSKEATGIEYTDVYTLKADHRTLTAGVLPDTYASLERYGFHPARFHTQETAI